MGFDLSGWQLPDYSPPATDVERAWLSFLRDIHGGQLRPPTLRKIQALQRAQRPGEGP